MLLRYKPAPASVSTLNMLFPKHIFFNATESGAPGLPQEFKTCKLLISVVDQIPADTIF